MKEFVANWIKEQLLELDSGLSGLVDIINPPNFWSISSSEYFLYAKGYQTPAGLVVYEGMATIVQPIATYILTLCWLISFIKICINMDILKTKFMFKIMTLGILARFAADNAYVFLGTIYATGASWASKLVASETFTIGTAASTKIGNMIKDYSMFESLGLMISSLVFIIGLNGVMIFIRVKAYARLFELTMIIGVAPLPFAFLPLEGGGANITKKYIFNFASICIEGFFMVASIGLFQNIVVNILTTEMDGAVSALGVLGKVFTYTVILLLAITSSSKWSKQIFEGA